MFRGKKETESDPAEKQRTAQRLIWRAAITETFQAFPVGRQFDYLGGMVVVCAYNRHTFLADRPPEGVKVRYRVGETFEYLDLSIAELRAIEGLPSIPKLTEQIV